MALFVLEFFEELFVEGFLELELGLGVMGAAALRFHTLLDVFCDLCD